MHPVSRFSVSRLYALGLAAALISLTSQPAHADCVNPPGPEGRLVYNVTSKVAQVCDGTNWIALSGSGGGGSITVPGNDTEVIFNDGGALGSDAAFVFNKGTGHVGIGVASPTLPLDVAGFVGTSGVQLTPTPADAPVPAGAPNLGDLADVDTSAQANGYVLTYNTATSKWEAVAASGGTVTGAAGSTGHVQFNNAGAFAGDAGLFWDNANKRLGIGTTVPRTRLEVAESLRIGRANSTVEGGDIRLDYPENNGTSINSFWAMDVYVSASDPGLRFYRNNADATTLTAMYLTTNGNVGIRTITPAAQLDVSGVIAASGRPYPWRWHTRSSGQTSFGTTSWTDIAGASITFNLPAAADVMVQFDTSALANEPNIHCNLAFMMDGVHQGSAAYGDVIFMGRADAWWHSVSRTRWFSLAAGSHTVKIRGSALPAPSSAGACSVHNDTYSHMTLTVMAYPTQ